MSQDRSLMTNAETDFFLAHSTIDGFVSFRHAAEGSYFTQTLLDVWEKHFDSLRLQTLMKKVNKERHLFSIKFLRVFASIITFESQKIQNNNSATQINVESISLCV